jgi:short-subunit dehydrogenase
LKNILIIGASSSIAEHCARLFAARGDSLFLVARNQEKLNSSQKDLTVRGATTVMTYLMDANDHQSHCKMLDQAETALHGIDTVMIAHGTLSNQKNCEQDVELTIQEINTNALSAIVLMTHIANRFEAKGQGTIAVISSVAGDRGRSSNYVYGSAKAMLSTFTSGLRQRLYKSNVAVVTIKPGFVDTPMTAEFKKGLLWAKPEVVAKAIIIAIDKGSEEVYVPAFWWVVMRLIKAIPATIFKKIRI